MQNKKSNKRAWGGYTLAQIREQKRLNQEYIAATKRDVNNRYRELTTLPSGATIALQVVTFLAKSLTGVVKNPTMIGKVAAFLMNLRK